MNLESKRDSLWGHLLQLNQDLRSDCRELPKAFRERDPAAKSTLEVMLLYPGFKAILAHRIAHALWQNQLHFSARALSEFTRFVTGIEIHPGAKVGRRVVIDHGHGVVVGETAEVGDDVTLYQGVTLGGKSIQPGKRHPTLCSGVRVGAGASVLGNIILGKNAQVGAGSVVLSNVPEGVSVVGIPATKAGQHSAKQSKE